MCSSFLILQFFICVASFGNYIITFFLIEDLYHVLKCTFQKETQRFKRKHILLHKISGLLKNIVYALNWPVQLYSVFDHV